ncbi:MAG: hypothetical protein AABY68_03185 [Pseudomonadota bacterium]
MKFSFALLPVVSAIVLSGCVSSYVWRPTPVAMSKIDADERVILTNINSGRVCAEPPPETQVTKSSIFNSLLGAADGEGKEARAEIYSSIAQQLTQLYKRSHSNQMYRDASYYLCQAYINGALTAQSASIYVNAITTASSISRRLSDDQKEKYQGIADQIKAMPADLKESDGAYLIAQMALTMLAFESLGAEISEFYKKEASEGAYAKTEVAGKLTAITTEINEIKGKVAASGSAAGEIKDSLAPTKAKLDEILTAVKSKKGEGADQ